MRSLISRYRLSFIHYRSVGLLRTANSDRTSLHKQEQLPELDLQVEVAEIVNLKSVVRTA